ncbi:MAG: hypothetical protein MUF84_17200 [Anaerolineae bacterium]|nr:hypothetical protein [Anaerolineae bacterium]
MKSRPYRRGIWLLLLALLSTVVPPLYAQESAPDPVLALIDRMSPEAKVGQLVLVTYPGTQVGDGADIARLIQEYGVGGVLLRPQNGNFGVSGLSPSELVSITNQLQMAAWAASVAPSTSPIAESEAAALSPYIPLLVGLQSSDAGVAPAELILGAPDLPTSLAIGATWDPALAQGVGSILGGELIRAGVNLYLGPDLDVLYTPRPGDGADLGTKAFGADPFWVGELGTAFIRGLHEGSGSQLLVVPRHLPGLGSADRPLEDEVPTVQKPLEQLKQIELAPFFAAARDLPGEAPESADGFLVTHIRYRGFQGNNIRRTTRPISLDAPALQLVAGLKEVAPWRAAGGLLVADNLGLPSVHLSYDPTGLTFNPRRVTQDALGAGNDLLVLDRFGSPDDWSVHFTNVRDTLTYLASRYRDESTFRSLVDQAAYRVLSAKLRAFPEFNIEDVLAESSSLQEDAASGSAVASQVASAALTRIFPLSEDLLPAPPQEGEAIVVFTHERQVGIGDDVDAVSLLDLDAIPEAILGFYGSQGTGVIRSNALQGFSFEDLLEALAAPGVTAVDEGEPLTVAVAVNRALQSADWILFATAGLNPADDAGIALKRFLATQANLLDARVVVLSFGPPYELDTTEISKLAAYYGLYSTGEAFVEAGVRAVFQDMLAPGASPVDIPALGYYVPDQMMPDPGQTISLAVVDAAGEELDAAARAAIHVGDMINLQTGVISDRNGHIVPDGTPVQFVLNYRQEASRNIVVGETVAGVAAAAITLERVGQLDVSAESEPAVSSVRLELTIRDDGVTITEVEPTPTATLAPTATATEEPTPTQTVNPVPAKAGQLPSRLSLPTPVGATLLRWGLVSALMVLAVAFMWARERSLPADRALTLALVGAIGSLLGYTALLALGRWWLPVLRFALVGREYLAGLTALVTGAVVCMAIVAINKDLVASPIGSAENLASSREVSEA